MNTVRFFIKPLSISLFVVLLLVTLAVSTLKSLMKWLFKFVTLDWQYPAPDYEEALAKIDEVRANLIKLANYAYREDQ
jgi:hypothetical protein